MAVGTARPLRPLVPLRTAVALIARIRHFHRLARLVLGLRVRLVRLLRFRARIPHPHLQIPESRLLLLIRTRLQSLLPFGGFTLLVLLTLIFGGGTGFIFIGASGLPDFRLISLPLGNLDFPVLAVVRGAFR